MASAMADRGLHATLVRTFLAVVMLSACSQEPAEQVSRVDCRDEVAAAFERLKTSGRPYRKETISVINDRLTSHETVEFLPPDRMRVITSYGILAWGNHETIRVGQRAWLNEEVWPWGWREFDPRPADDLLARLQTIPPDDATARTRMIFAAAGRDSTSVRLVRLQDRPVLPGDVFECLGRVEFEGAVYLGYRVRLDRVEFELAVASRETKQQELSRKPQDWPQDWRTVFVDPQRRLPAYDIVTRENQLDNPRDKTQYTYPNNINIRIEPPLWCRLGLCSGSR